MCGCYVVVFFVVMYKFDCVGVIILFNFIFGSVIDVGGEEDWMVKNDGEIVIKKYVNWWFYNIGISIYVMFDDFVGMVKCGEDFVV